MKTHIQENFLDLNQIDYIRQGVLGISQEILKQYLNDQEAQEQPMDIE